MKSRSLMKYLRTQRVAEQNESKEFALNQRLRKSAQDVVGAHSADSHMESLRRGEKYFCSG